MVNDLPVLNIESELPEGDNEDTSHIDKMFADSLETMKKGRYDQAIIDLYKIEFALQSPEKKHLDNQKGENMLCQIYNNIAKCHMEIKEYDDVISLSEQVLKRNRFDTDCLLNYARAIFLKNDRCKKNEKKRSVFLIMDILGTIKEIKEVNSLLKDTK